MKKRVLNATEIRHAISGKSIQFKDGARQSFYPDGTTHYFVNGRKEPGTWGFQGDLYVSAWPPSTHLTFYKIEATTNEQDEITGLTFIEEGFGDSFSGTFIE